MRSNLRRHVSGSKNQQLRCSTENGGSGSTLVGSLEHHADEHTALLHRAFQNSDGEPFYKDGRPWVRWPSRFGYVAWQTLTSNPVNVLLVFVPLGIISGTIGWSPTVIFVLNFLAIIPLASLLSFATEEISVKLGQTLGGLMNATFGNAVELIVCPLTQLRAIPLTGSVGQHCRIEERRDPHRPSEYAWLHPFEYPPGPRLLLPCWRNKAQRAEIQFNCRINHVVTDGRLNGVTHHSCHPLRRHG